MATETVHTETAQTKPSMSVLHHCSSDRDCSNNQCCDDEERCECTEYGGLYYVHQTYVPCNGVDDGMFSQWLCAMSWDNHVISCQKIICAMMVIFARGGGV